ncbi:hypothetical protein FNV43_RR21358 [Rhamnella rubrinervis]|uniref:Uncharacterized protein n=1 Tax=Rhamnella rubrinervis TaxID=2594499 RepID=A0A8K0GXP4_9ROSA|nr:hypothetical protein FNV43_RR21358 [Rhamnella rubrinervis]
MVRLSSVDGSSSYAGFLVYLWLALLSVCILSAIIFSCTDGVSKEKTSTADTELYGGGCAAGCGAGCGAACGA